MFPHSLVAALFALALPAGLPSVHHGRLALHTLQPRGPLLAGSRFPLLAPDAPAGVRFTLLGPGKIEGTTYVAPQFVARAERATIVAATAKAVGATEIALAPMPPASQALVAVASYDDGIALHRRSDGSLVGIVALEGGVADVARDGSRLLAPSVRTDTLWSLDLHGMHVHATNGVVSGNETAASRNATFVTDRDIGAGNGALTRIDRHGSFKRVITGVTAEGLALDTIRRRAYVSNVNNSSVVAVDLDELRIVRRYKVPSRPFGLALDAAAQRLYVASNEPRRPGFAGGRVTLIDLTTGRILARSAPFVFSLGVAYDPRRRRVFVTDESTRVVTVLDGRTLARVAKLTACDLPWRPALDAVRRRLYVPCARANAVAIFDADTLRAVARSPRATGGYPLGVAF